MLKDKKEKKYLPVAAVLCLGLLFLFAAQPGIVVAAQDSQKPLFFGKSKEPIDITSDELDFDQKKLIATFTGNVVALQDETSLQADTLEVFFAESDDHSLREIIASGTEVVIKMLGKKALCRRMHYYADERKIILTGSPSLDDGKNIISGEEITFFLDEDRSVIKGGQQKRVKTILFPGQRGGPGLR
ncbi:MAG: lipopolysaccharide transport periplasmic protein LptA [Deltaproteobacteria bacterium]|nr:lipopolysaccharide transport periplasmic protein LptA [Deltaproteobacteria bacterium]